MGVGFADFGWSSEQFWSLTILEFLTALKRKFPPEPETPTKSGTHRKPVNMVTRVELDEAIKKYGRTIILDR
jgi:hypothetical protein